MDLENQAMEERSMAMVNEEEARVPEPPRRLPC
jgi:hypothetical protein